MTRHQRRWAEPWPEMIAAVRALIDDGHEVIIWSGNTRYARRWCEKHDIKPQAALGKPDVLVDNQLEKWGNRLKNRMITPEQLLEGK